MSRFELSDRVVCAVLVTFFSTDVHFKLKNNHVESVESVDSCQHQLQDGVGVY